MRFRAEWFGSASRTRTYDRAINSRLLYQLSYRGKRLERISVPDTICKSPLMKKVRNLLVALRAVTCYGAVVAFRNA